MKPAPAPVREQAKRTPGRSTAAVLAAIACGLLLTVPAAAQKKPKPKKEEVTQTLQLPKDLPGAVTGDTRRLTFHVTPLSARGLLSAQIREALKALSRETGNNPVLKIRAFVAGSGDLRRVRDIVSEVFADRRLPLPALSLVQAGGLPMEGAQVVLEAIAAARKDVNPHGLVFLSAPPASSDNPLDPLEPLAATSLARLKSALQTARSQPADVVRLTCFLSSLETLPAVRKLVEADYPRVPVNFVQTQRTPSRALASCEAVARLTWDTGKPLLFQPESGEPQAALVAAPRVVLTASQVSFGYQESNTRLAFERVARVLEANGVSGKDVAFAHFYPLAESLAAQVRKLRPEFFGIPAGTLLVLEGLPGLDAGFAVDVVAVKP
ncbi:MAG: RidA family protein [Candidatus Solibacter sp.]